MLYHWFSMRVLRTPRSPWGGCRGSPAKRAIIYFHYHSMPKEQNDRIYDCFAHGFLLLLPGRELASVSGEGGSPGAVSFTLSRYARLAFLCMLFKWTFRFVRFFPLSYLKHSHIQSNPKRDSALSSNFWNHHDTRFCILACPRGVVNWHRGR